jgi:activator of 2-hydroxyglutaryl-CoA dehydratase
MKVYQLALDEPVVLTGGMACVPGVVDEFQRRLSETLQRDVAATRPDDPDLAAAQGANMIAERLSEGQ